MPRFYVNQIAETNGIHIVHQNGNCPHIPHQLDRYDLGYHTDCNTAIKEAKNSYVNVNGCLNCCKKCYTDVIYY